MVKIERLKLEMFERVRNFGITSRDVFPEDSWVGKKFAQLAAEVKVIAEQLVRQGLARAEARKVKVATRNTARDYMKSVALVGRRLTADEVGPHPFRLPVRRSATEVLATARLFMEEAERRKDKFAEVGLQPTFLTDFSKAVDGLAAAVAVQQDSRAARHKAAGAIAAALKRGMVIVADLDATVTGSLRGDAERLSEWMGARRMEQSGEEKAAAPSATEPTPDASVETPASPSDPKPTVVA